MQVILAGHSIDRDALKDGWSGSQPSAELPSPETLAAAYARISRDSAPVDVLRARARADVDAARRSNRAIVFGMGHHSVAEHVQLNFDILGISRLALEALEEARLCSFTEKSQRYVTLTPDHVVPAELTKPERELLRRVAAAQYACYAGSLPRLLRHHQEHRPDLLTTAQGRSTVEGWAKEDARYALGLATTAQLGFSANARNLEQVIRKTRHHPLAEVRELSHRLYETSAEVVPSLIILSDGERFREVFGREVSDDFLSRGPLTLHTASSRILTPQLTQPTEKPSTTQGVERHGVRLVDHTPEPDVVVAAALLFAGSMSDHATCLDAARELSRTRPHELGRYLLEALRWLTEYDPPPRAFETATFTFELELSASAFAQLKRHRLLTLLKQPYDPELPCTVPESVIETGQRAEFEQLWEASATAYRQVRDQVGPAVAEYLLTNAHHRRVLVTCNLRELYHFVRLRLDHHAQWDIRRIAGQLADQVRQVAPGCSQLLTSKDTFARVRAAAWAGSEEP